MWQGNKTDLVFSPGTLSVGTEDLREFILLLLLSLNLFPIFFLSPPLCFLGEAVNKWSFCLKEKLLFVASRHKELQGEHLLAPLSELRVQHVPDDRDKWPTPHSGNAFHGIRLSGGA